MTAISAVGAGRPCRRAAAAPAREAGDAGCRPGRGRARAARRPRRSPSTPRAAQRRDGRGGEPVGQQPGRRRLAQPGADDGEVRVRHRRHRLRRRPAVTSSAAVRSRARPRPARRGSARPGTCAGLQRGELLAQHRHDLLAEDVQLLQHGLQRQAGVVDQEQLALVVADVVAEAQRPLDDLLRAADGQRRLRGELLQRRAVAVDRGVVEVRPELAHGVLAVLAA